MAKDQVDQTKVEPLGTKERWTAAVLGVALLALVVLAVLWDRPTVQEWTTGGSLIKRTRSVSDLSGVLTVLVAAGAALLAYALNGLRLIKLGFGSVSIDALPSVESTREESLADVPGVDAAPLGQGKVPIQVLADALSAWPADAGDPPTNLDEFENGWKRGGQGSHPWFLKFKDRPVVRVYYGGRGRSGPHVSSPESD